jgi:hypothetical protein
MTGNKCIYDPSREMTRGVVHALPGMDMSPILGSAPHEENMLFLGSISLGQLIVDGPASR